MNAIDEKLYEYLGDKTLSFGCKVIDNDWYDAICVWDTNMHTILDDQWYLVRDVPDEKVWIMKILGHEPTIADLHKWMIKKSLHFAQNTIIITVHKNEENTCVAGFNYHAYKSLLEQSEETKEAINKLIEEYENN